MKMWAICREDNKKPINLEPKSAGLMGSSNWGHQRKAVALNMTGAAPKSSRVLQKT
ncbi:hypothetical protein HQN64_03705 [Enterobacteriaceae bacterium BIT-l23]|uniref:hypothetical protein n=1 Tax=Jejubacter TaxID=2815296 RepID=UPI00143D4334|nr:hypothetical protein [Jejubacter calystegiae]NUU65205.1 hypothetical protein [Enterobacteriaceae bacterium BIT-l23]